MLRCYNENNRDLCLVAPDRQSDGLTWGEGVGGTPGTHGAGVGQAAPYLQLVGHGGVQALHRGPLVSGCGPCW